ncbi:uncharacterized protein [Euwallacea similis]|uniref:uncharacterized protein n=1 Tax=Euwallacea similis TaxID=1736056 RepID=UPI00344F8B6E
MRRQSPPRMRHRSPPPRRRRHSMSPLSRSQPVPPGEERNKSKLQFDPPNKNNKRFRSRSREREWSGRSLDRPIDREPPFITFEEHDRPRGRDRRPEERERDRNNRLGTRDLDLKRRAHPRGQIIPDHYEESYLDHAPTFNNKGGLPRGPEIILDPSVMNFSPFSQERVSPENARNAPERPLRRESPPRERRRSPVNFHSSAHRPKIEKGESEKDRLQRLEKLVEKLVERNIKPESAKSSSSTAFSSSPSDKKIAELIPSNTRFTTSMWLNSIHEECLRRNYDEKTCIRFTKDQMTSIMKAWFKTVSSYDFTWPELKLLITRTFPDNIDFAQTLKVLALRDKTVDETLTQYYFSKLYLCEACKISGENAVSCMIDGLNNPFMKQDVRAQNFLTPEALYSEYLSKCPERDIPVHADPRETREVVMPQEYTSQPQFIPIDVQHPQDPMTYHEMKEQDRRRCYTCKKVGHKALDCRHAPICYNCSRRGHIAAKCPSATVHLISIEGGKIPIKQCKVNASKYFGLIDTGSTAVTIKRQVAKELGLHQECSSKVLDVFGGGRVGVSGEVEVLLEVDNVERMVKALVVDDYVQEVPVIIGQEYLSQVCFYQVEAEIVVCENLRN